MYRQFGSHFMTQYKSESSSEMVSFMVIYRPSFHFIVNSRELVKYLFLSKFTHAYNIMYRSKDMNRQFGPLFMTQYKTESSSEVVGFMDIFRPSFRFIVSV